MESHYNSGLPFSGTRGPSSWFAVFSGAAARFLCARPRARCRCHHARGLCTHMRAPWFGLVGPGSSQPGRAQWRKAGFPVRPPHLRRGFWGAWRNDSDASGGHCVVRARPLDCVVCEATYNQRPPRGTLEQKGLKPSYFVVLVCFLTARASLGCVGLGPGVPSRHCLHPLQSLFCAVGCLGG